jgi:nicotinate-nucleotide pyrophosphorylase (carboxylating)
MTDTQSLDESVTTALDELPASAYQKLLDLALAEDLNTSTYTPTADLTSAWTVPPGASARATIIAKEAGVVAGLEVTRAVFAQLDPAILFDIQTPNGRSIQDQQILVRLAGPAAALLTGERTALNFLQRLCGVATLTRAYCDAVAATSARITETRKTTPGFRLLEKRAVVLGGGVNHRFGLYDAVLIKENHAVAAGGVGPAVAQARAAGQSNTRVMVEAETLEETRQLAPLNPDRILLDNMDIATLLKAVPIIRQANEAIEIEATGNITLENVAQVATTGVDFISIGALTHSAPALDLSLLFDLE